MIGKLILPAMIAKTCGRKEKSKKPSGEISDNGKAITPAVGFSMAKTVFALSVHKSCLHSEMNAALHIARSRKAGCQSKALHSRKKIRGNTSP